MSEGVIVFLIVCWIVFARAISIANIGRQITLTSGGQVFGLIIDVLLIIGLMALV